jgi:periplasmic mercuric ion binding protein
MTRLLTFVLGLSLLGGSATFAAERTVTLAVRNMYCAACPHTVRASLQAVPGVRSVVVSMHDKTAVVTYDDARASLSALTAATTNAGYPSAPRSQSQS